MKPLAPTDLQITEQALANIADGVVDDDDVTALQCPVEPAEGGWWVEVRIFVANFMVDAAGDDVDVDEDLSGLTITPRKP